MWHKHIIISCYHKNKQTQIKRDSITKDSFHLLFAHLKEILHTQSSQGIFSFVNMTRNFIFILQYTCLILKFLSRIRVIIFFVKLLNWLLWCGSFFCISKYEKYEFDSVSWRLEIINCNFSIASVYTFFFSYHCYSRQSQDN